MNEISVIWQILIQLTVPVITAIATIVAVIIAANRSDERRRVEQVAADHRRQTDQHAADRRRHADQVAEDRRRQGDLDERERERQRQLDRELKEQQLQAVTDFLIELRQAESELSAARRQLATQRNVQDEPVYVSRTSQRGSIVDAYTRLQHRLYSAVEILDLRITHEEVHQAVAVMISAFVTYSKEIAKYSKSHTEYLKAVLADPGSNHLHDQVPDEPNLTPGFRTTVEELRKTARLHLNPQPE